MTSRYLDDEVKSGFYIPAIMKQCWAAELEVLKEVDKLCEKHGITYYAEWGTLLGAVRHGGFIPWDDDLDISMKRADYERFLEVAHELPPGFEVQNLRNKKDFDQFLANVIGKSRICFEPEHLEKFHGFPYIAGLDIFIMDYVCEDNKKEELRDKIANYVIALADDVFEGKIKKNELPEHLNRIESNYPILLCRERIFNTQDNLCENLDVRQYLYSMAESMLWEFKEEESRELVQLVPWGLKGHYQNMPKEYYDQIVRIPFENTTIPVPYRYEEILSRRYGDYMKVVKNVAGHDYPCFGIQQKKLEQVLDFGLQKYIYQPEHTKYREYNADTIADIKKGSYKTILKEAFCGLEELYQQYWMTKDIAVLVELQQLAIDIGTLIESVKGEGKACVKMLEKICESAFLLSQEDTKDDLQTEIEQFGRLLEAEVLSRKEIVFVSFDAKYWNRMQLLYEEEKKNPLSDVYVIHIPTYRKTYDMQLVEEEYHPELYPDDIAIYDYREYDFALRYPEKIYIQSSYDEYNPTWSVHPFFYSSNLIKYTDMLAYIPWFVTDCFTADNEREYLNMQYYVTMPGVCYSDCVILSDDKMVNVYIRKLTDWAGCETQKIWEQKIVVKEPEMISQSHKISNGTKCLLYYVGIGPLLAYKAQMLQKIKNSCEIFDRYKQHLSYFYMTEPEAEEILKKEDPIFYQEYMDVVSQIPQIDLEIEEIMEQCDAYYGCASYIANMFRDSGKPVMIQNVQII